MLPTQIELKIGDLFYTAGKAQIHVFLGAKGDCYHFYGPVWNDYNNEYVDDNCHFWENKDKKWIDENFYEKNWNVIKCR